MIVTYLVSFVRKTNHFVIEFVSEADALKLCHVVNCDVSCIPFSILQSCIRFGCSLANKKTCPALSSASSFKRRNFLLFTEHDIAIDRKIKISVQYIPRLLDFHLISNFIADFYRLFRHKFDFPTGDELIDFFTCNTSSILPKARKSKPSHVWASLS